MTKRLLILGFALALALACGRPPQFDFDLEGIVYQEGDLQVEGASVGVQTLDREKDWKYDSWAELQVVDPDADILVLVDVILFTDKKELIKAYESFLASEVPMGFEEYDVPGIGYAFVGKKQPWFGGQYALYFTFQRCYAMVNVWARFDNAPAVTEENLLAYASALDARLNRTVCPI